MNTRKVLSYGAATVLGGMLLGKAAGGVVNRFADRVVDRIVKDPYEENWFEAISQFIRVGLQEIIEIDLRATGKDMLLRPMGSPKKMPSLQGLMFNIAQLGPLPTAHDKPINTRVTIGAHAQKPLTIDIPIMIAGMGYGLFMSKAAKIALARAATKVGTATNTGEGPFLIEERQEAQKLIVQYHRGNWMRLDTLAKADAVEIHIGQGASGGVGMEMPVEKVSKNLCQEMDLPPGEPPLMRSTFPEIAEGRGLIPLVERARTISGGAPVLVKLAASHLIERELERVFQSGADGVVLDGAQAGTGQSPPIAQDDFGIPTLYALVRARRFLDRIDPQRRFSLIVAGGLYTPGDFMKCLALGADAVYVGTAVMLAMMAGQQIKSTPGEPPTQVIAYQGNHHRHFDIDQGAERAAQFLDACRLEIEFGLRMLGKEDVCDLSPDDLCALDDETAKVTGVDVAYKEPQKRSDHETTR